MDLNKETTSKETAKEQNNVQDLCLFCKKDVDDVVKYGHKIQQEDVTIHYFCMLFASGLCQNGECETDGIKGFLLKDIKLEVSRGKRLKCIYCEEKGATVGCVVTKCRKVFHYPCGYENGMLNQYFGSFQSFCEEHRPTQAVPVRDRLAFKGTANTTCLICMYNVEARASNNTLRAPCCKNSWFHRTCIQRMATCSGVHFFKCPLCNNKEIFQNEMLEHGIYIPDQDAAWELEPNAFQELLQRHCRCDVEKCQSVKGRQYNKDNSKWEIMLCDWCGSQGTHLTCSSLKSPMDDWICADCQKIVGKNFRKKNKKKMMSPEEKALPKEWLEFKNKSEYPGKTKMMRKTKKSLNFSTIKLRPGQKQYPGISDVRVVLKDLKQDKKVAKQTKKRSSPPTCTLTSSSVAAEESSLSKKKRKKKKRLSEAETVESSSSLLRELSPEKKRRKLHRINGEPEEIGPVDLANRPNWFKAMMSEDIVTGANLGRQFSHFPLELGINKPSQSESYVQEGSSEIQSSGQVSDIDCEIAFSKPVINERRRWLQREQNDDTTYDLDMSTKPRWYQELMSTDIITGKNLGANFAEVHEKLDVVQSSSPQISPLKPAFSTVDKESSDEALPSEIPPAPTSQGRKVSKYRQRDSSPLSPALVSQKVAKKGRELKALLMEDIVTGNNLGTKFSDLHESLLPIPILSPVKPNAQEQSTSDTDVGDSCPPRLKRFDESESDSSIELDTVMDKSNSSDNFIDTSTCNDVTESSLSKDILSTEVCDTCLLKDVTNTVLAKDNTDTSSSKEVDETKSSKDVSSENQNSEIRPISGNKFYRKTNSQTTPKQRNSTVVEEIVSDVLKTCGENNANIQLDGQGKPSQHEEIKTKDRNIFSQLEKEFLPLEDLILIGKEANNSFLQETIQQVTVCQEEEQQEQSNPCDIYGNGSQNSKNSLTEDQRMDLNQIVKSNAVPELISDGIGTPVQTLQSLRFNTKVDIQSMLKENEKGNRAEATDSEGNVVVPYDSGDTDEAVPRRKKPGRPKLYGQRRQKLPFHAMKTRLNGFNYVPKKYQKNKPKPGKGQGRRGRPCKPITQEVLQLAKELQAKHDSKVKKFGRPMVHGKFSIFSDNEQFIARYFRNMAIRKLQKDTEQKQGENEQKSDDVQNNQESSREIIEAPGKEETAEHKGRKPWKIKLKPKQMVSYGCNKKMGRPLIHGKYSIFNGDEGFRKRYLAYAEVRKRHREMKRQAMKNNKDWVERKRGRPRKDGSKNNSQCEEKKGNSEEACTKKRGRPKKSSVVQNMENATESSSDLNEPAKEIEEQQEDLNKEKLGGDRKGLQEPNTTSLPNQKTENDTCGESQTPLPKKPRRQRKQSFGKNLKVDHDGSEKESTSPGLTQKENSMSGKKQIKITSFFNQNDSLPVLHERKDTSFNASAVADSTALSQPEYVDLEDLFEISPLKSPQGFKGLEREETFEEKSLMIEKECMKQLYSDVLADLSNHKEVPNKSIEHANTNIVQKKLTSYVNDKRTEANSSVENDSSQNATQKSLNQPSGSYISNHEEVRPIAMISPMKVKDREDREHTESPKANKTSIMQHAKNFFFNKFVSSLNGKENEGEISPASRELEKNNIQPVGMEDVVVVSDDN